MGVRVAMDGVDRVRDVVWVDIVRDKAVAGVGMVTVSDMAEAGQGGFGQGGGWGDKARLKYSTFYESIHAVDSRHGIWV